MNVKELRNAGYKVKVLHNRLYDGIYLWQTHSPRPSYSEADSKGGSTTVIIDSPDGYHFEGHAICSNKENYNKKLGVRIALGRSGIYDKITNYSIR